MSRRKNKREQDATTAALADIARRYPYVPAAELNRLPAPERLGLARETMDARAAAFEQMRAAQRDRDAVKAQWRECQDDPAWRAHVVDALRAEEGARPELDGALDPFFLVDEDFPEDLAVALCEQAWPDGWLMVWDDEEDGEP